MSKRRRQFDRAFKVEAVRLVNEEGRTAASVARDLGISANLLYRWREEFESDSQSAFVGTGNVTAEQAELRRLRRQLADVTEERDILKKAVAVFSGRKK